MRDLKLGMPKDEIDGGDDEKPYERFIDELPPDEVKLLKSYVALLKKYGRKAVKKLKIGVVEDWEDDHEICIGVKVGNVEFGLWWIGRTEAAAWEYPDSKKAIKEIIIQIESEVPEQVIIHKGAKGLVEDEPYVFKSDVLVNVVSTTTDSTTVIFWDGNTKVECQMPK